MTKNEAMVWLYSVAGRYATMIAPTFAKNNWQWTAKRNDWKSEIPTESEIHNLLLKLINEMVNVGYDYMSSRRVLVSLLPTNLAGKNSNSFVAVVGIESRPKYGVEDIQFPHLRSDTLDDTYPEQLPLWVVEKKAESGE